MALEEIIGVSTIEEELVRRASVGEFDAFETLLQLYKRSLWRFVYRMLNNTEDANDAIQQILIKVYKALPTLSQPARFRSWLFMIARNECLDHLRRKSSLTFADLGEGEDSSGDYFSPLYLFPDPAPLPDEVIERRETQALLREAIASLPERTRLVVNLRYTTDLSFSEIGETLGINENTSKALFQRAKGQLRNYIRQRL